MSIHKPVVARTLKEGEIRVNQMMMLFIVDEEVLREYHKLRSDTQTRWALSYRAVFARGQLYVAVFRVTDGANLRIVVPDAPEARREGKIKNVVYSEVFS
jgi:hypothetical protein